MWHPDLGDYLAATAEILGVFEDSVAVYRGQVWPDPALAAPLR